MINLHVTTYKNARTTEEEPKCLAARHKLIIRQESCHISSSPMVPTWRCLSGAIYTQENPPCLTLGYSVTPDCYAWQWIGCSWSEFVSRACAWRGSSLSFLRSLCFSRFSRWEATISLNRGAQVYLRVVTFCLPNSWATDAYEYIVWLLKHKLLFRVVGSLLGSFVCQ